MKFYVSIIKNVMAAFAVLTLTAVGGFAADVYDGPRPYPSVSQVQVNEPQVNWTGFYAALAAGTVFSNTEDTYVYDDGHDRFTANLDGHGGQGFLGCLEGGYDQELRNPGIVVGLYGEACVTNHDTQFSFSYNGSGAGASVDAQHTFGGGLRLGVPLSGNRTLAYGKVGVRRTHVEGGGLLSGYDEDFTGLYLGVGLDHQLDNHWVLGLEGGWTNYQDQTYRLGADETLNVDPESAEVKGRIGYRFN